jgi:hypothetical protein
MYDGLLYIVYSGNKRYNTKLYGSSRFRDPLNRSTCKIEKTRTDQAGSKLTEPNSGFFFFFRKSGNCLVCLNCSYDPVQTAPEELDEHLVVRYYIFFLSKPNCTRVMIVMDL